MENNVEVFTINKDQLLSLRNFRFYCHHRALELEDEFYDAAIKEGFIQPLMVEGAESLFSPHQIMMVALLRHNVVRDGILVFPEDVVWIGNKAVRAIKVGGGFVGQDEFEKRVFEWNRLYENFLKVLHGFPTSPFHMIPESKMRAYYDDVELGYDFSSLKTPEKRKILDSYGLTEDKLKDLRKEFGIFVHGFDPLSEWFYYLEKHARWRKEQFKGEPRLAQELYFVIEVIKEFMEALFGPQKDLPALVDEGWRIGRRREEEFISGIDFGSLQKGLQHFKLWCEKKENAHYVPEKLPESIGEFAKELEDFGEKFGKEFHMPNGISYQPKVDAKWLLEDLPERYRKIHVSHLDAKRTIEDRDVEDGVGHYLFDLSRNLLDLMSVVEKKLSDEFSELWHERNSLGQNRLWSKEKDQELAEKIEKMEKLRDEFYEIERITRRVLCYHCGENPVPVLDRRNQSEDLLCVSCIRKTAELALAETEGEVAIFRRRETGRWLCDRCGSLLHKFSNRNTFIAEGQNGNMPVMTLKYGEIEMEVRCKGTKRNKCGYINKRVFSYGWQK